MIETSGELLAKAAAKRTQADAAVRAFIEGLPSALKEPVDALRTLILSLDPAIGEGIKWNTPSFQTHEWFATFNLRDRSGAERVWLILHAGVKAKDNPASSASFPDPAGLLTWLGPDRARIAVADAGDVEAKREVLTTLLKAWIARL